MTYAAEIRDRARALRVEGKTLRAIAELLDSNRSTIQWLCWDIPHPNRPKRRQRGSAKRQAECLQCGVTFTAWGRGHICYPCRILRCQHRGQQQAATAVAKAIRTGLLPRPTGLPCTDCTRPAEEYDHRDYNRPLDVQPVCRRCNARRGPAKWVQFEPVSALLAKQRCGAVF